MNGFLGLHDPFFRPVWRRIVTVAACLGWALFEFVAGAPIWGALFVALGVAAAWHFFIVPWPDDGDDKP